MHSIGYEKDQREGEIEGGQKTSTNIVLRSIEANEIDSIELNITMPAPISTNVCGYMPKWNLHKSSNAFPLTYSQSKVSYWSYYTPALFINMSNRCEEFFERLDYWIAMSIYSIAVQRAICAISCGRPHCLKLHILLHIDRVPQTQKDNKHTKHCN